MCSIDLIKEKVKNYEINTYNEDSPFTCFNASAGITVRPQLCNDNRLSLCNPINAS